MTLAQIKEIRDTYKAVPGIVIDIYLDNDSKKSVYGIHTFGKVR